MAESRPREEEAGKHHSSLESIRLFMNAHTFSGWSSRWGLATPQLREPDN